MNTVEAIKNILVTKIYVEVSPAEMSLDDNMRDVFGVDSLGFVELRSQVEEVFDISITDDDFTPENFMTIGRLQELIEKLSSRSAADGAVAV